MNKLMALNYQTISGGRWEMKLGLGNIGTVVEGLGHFGGGEGELTAS